MVKSREEMWKDFVGYADARVRKAFQVLGVNSFDDLAEKTIEDFMEIRGFGFSSLHVLRERAKDYGVKILSSHENRKQRRSPQTVPQSDRAALSTGTCFTLSSSTGC